MITSFKILWNSFKMAVQELRVNKLRTFLSLLGITIGIFCIIAVFTFTSSLEYNIRKDLADLGDDVIYVQKWPWGGNGEYPWWKYVNRLAPQYKDLKPVQDKVQSASFAAFVFEVNNKKIEQGNDYMDGARMMAVTHDFEHIQPMQLLDGRFFSTSESNSGANVAILGADLWDGLFPSAESAIGKLVKVAGREIEVIGVLKKKGESMVGGFSYDNAIILPYRFARTVIDERRNSEPFIMVKVKPNISLDQLKEELRGVVRAAHRLKPTEEDDFALNEISSASNNVGAMFAAINIGGGFIAIFALIVGAFGIANIMFVSVKERTAIIGLKKAIGARRSIILTEFLLEAVCLCLFGGVIGLLLVYLMTLMISVGSSFTIILSRGIIFFGLSISVIVGLLSGYIPAYTASKLDPVVAIRSN